MGERAQLARGAGHLGEEAGGVGLGQPMLELGGVGRGVMAGALEHPGAGARRARGSGRGLGAGAGGARGRRRGEGAGVPLGDQAQQAVAAAQQVVVEQQPGGLIGMAPPTPSLDQNAKVVEPGAEEGGDRVHVSYFS